MPLPMTKIAFDRLGERLIAHQSPSEADLADLHTAPAAYQEVLGQVKLDLRDLGFAPTDRVKATTTMIDKLRRTPGMDLSRMQDLAGARITVRNLAAQDEAKDKISEFYTTQGSPVREIDRRIDPRFGYRAMHLVVRVDELPVEIQIRTELQDSWAQIVERLGDTWGRGIRYGQEPEDAETIVATYDEEVFDRRDLLALLMTLSDAIWSTERNRRILNESKQVLTVMDSMWQKLQAGAWPELLDSKIPPGLFPERDVLVAALTARYEQLDAEVRELLPIQAADLTNAQLRRMLEILIDFLRRDNTTLAAGIVRDEQRMRDMLNVIAAAADEGV
jgi:ppGpp synthetase/RelA/SpoT-type nucleotidyltranferase